MSDLDSYFTSPEPPPPPQESAFSVAQRADIDRMSDAYRVIFSFIKRIGTGRLAHALGLALELDVETALRELLVRDDATGLYDQVAFQRLDDGVVTRVKMPLREGLVELLEREHGRRIAALETAHKLGQLRATLLSAEERLRRSGDLDLAVIAQLERLLTSAVERIKLHRSE